MLPWDCGTVKRKKDDDGSISTVGTWGAMEHRARVRDMTARMAAKAGFRHSGRSKDKGSAPVKTLPAVQQS